jgi:ATP-binding cassette subfamily B multidrug efflux pump
VKFVSIFKDLFWYFKKEKRSYISGVILLVFVTIFVLIPPYIVGIVIDEIVEGTLTQDSLLKWIKILLGVGIIVYILRYIWRILIFGSAIRLGKLLRNQLYEHFTKMSPQFYHKKRIGDLMAHATNDIQAVEGTAGEGVLTLVDSLTMGGFVVLMMAFAINWQLTLIVLIPMPFMAWATSYYGKLLHQRFHKAQASFSDLNDKVQESISGVRVIKAFGQENAEIQDFKKKSQDVVEKNIAVARVDALFDPTISLIVGLSFFLAISVGSIFVVKETLTLGQLTTFTMYLGLLIWPMLAFGWLFNIVERGRASYDRVRILLDIKPDIIEKDGAIDLMPSGDIYCQINSFTYPEKQEPTLEDVSFTLKQGQTLGIVGKTGAGKTTLLRLFLREFDGIRGEVKIGAHSIYDVSLHGLRGAIGYVPQDHFLFSASLAENISFARPSSTLEEIKQAAKLACIDEDIVRFEEGYETEVGERGVTLSGGQKQRISIARSLLMDPEILLLDDSLSAVDAKTEESILQALKSFRENKTTMITAHRLSAIQHADLILVLDEGKVAERGTHLELMNKNGWYAKMFKHQQLEIIVAKGGQSS